MSQLNQGERRTFLAVGAHPDDIEEGAGGVIAMLVEQGWGGTFLVCTDGAKGARDPEGAIDLAARRAGEQKEAAARLGVKEVIHLAHVDGELVSDLELRGEIVRVIRDVRPSVVFAWDPESYWIGDMVMNHTDHMVAGEATCYAVYPAALNVMTFPEQLTGGRKPHRVDELWLFGTNRPNVFVDVATHQQQKAQAQAAHVSQLAGYFSDEERRLAAQWLVREYDNPVIRQRAEAPELIESFRRILLGNRVMRLDPAIAYESFPAPV